LTDHRPDEQPSGLAEVTGLGAVVARHRDDEVVPVDDDLGSRHAESVHTRADDLLGLIECLTGGLGAVGGAGGQGDPGAALQVDAQLRFGLLASGQEDQQVNADQHDQKQRQVAVGVHRRR
jgi:hypothetical protein